MCGIVGLGLLVSLLIRDYPLDRFRPQEHAKAVAEQETMQVPKLELRETLGERI